MGGCESSSGSGYRELLTSLNSRGFDADFGHRWAQIGHRCDLARGSGAAGAGGPHPLPSLVRGRGEIGCSESEMLFENPGVLLTELKLCPYGRGCK